MVLPSRLAALFLKLPLQRMKYNITALQFNWAKLQVNLKNEIWSLEAKRIASKTIQVNLIYACIFGYAFCITCDVVINLNATTYSW